VTAAHGKHFDKSKACAACHGTLPTTTAHITPKSSLVNGSIAANVQANAVKDFTASTSVYQWASGTKSCYSGRTTDGMPRDGGRDGRGGRDAAAVDRDDRGGCLRGVPHQQHPAAVNATSGLHNMTAAT